MPSSDVPAEGGAAHWERVHETKSPDEVSWAQGTPALSLRLIEAAGVNTYSHILDMGGGVSCLADHLLTRGHERLTVLDISEAALKHTRERLGELAARVHFIVGDALDAELPQDIGLWHDRAVFHFLTDEGNRARYVERLRRHLKSGAHAVVATFAEDGPQRCSGLPTMRYSADALHAELGIEAFERIGAEVEVHVTPQGREQRFQYLLLRRR